MRGKPDSTCPTCHGHGVYLIPDVSPGGSPDEVDCDCVLDVALCPRCPFPSAAGPDGLCHAHSDRAYPVTPGTAWRATISKDDPPVPHGKPCPICGVQEVHP
jgi:hypothetical protein